MMATNTREKIKERKRKKKDDKIVVKRNIFPNMNDFLLIKFNDTKSHLCVTDLRTITTTTAAATAAR